jgi:hypothetical protein
MSKIGEYIIWCQEEGYTDDAGDVVSMKYADLYMKTMEYEREHRDYSKLLLDDYTNNKIYK